MAFFSRFRKNREHEVEMKVNQLLGSVLNDNNEFTDKEQSFIIRSLFDKFKDVKSQERQTALNKANEITESLKLLK